MLKKSAIILILTIFALMVSGCASQETDYISEEYDQHLSTFEEDTASLNDAINKWNDALAMAEADGYINDDESSHLIDIANEYVTEMNRINPHTNSFKKFIEENEMTLKDIGLDTYEDKKALDDFQTKLDENYEAVNETNSNLKVVGETNSIYEEYEQHLSTFEEDIVVLYDAIDKWNDALAVAEADGYINDGEYDHLANVANEYITEMNQANPHIDSFRAFIEENENALKDIDLDTYEDKKALDDFQTDLDENYESLKTSIEG